MNMYTIFAYRRLCVPTLESKQKSATETKFYASQQMTSNNQARCIREKKKKHTHIAIVLAQQPVNSLNSPLNQNRNSTPIKFEISLMTFTEKN